MKTPFKWAPSAVQLYAALVIATGACVLWLRLPSARFDQPLLFWALLAGSVIISALKVHIPLGRGTATLSMSYITDFLALVLLGADEGMLIAGTSGATQCLLMTRGRPTLGQTLFSGATLIIAMQVTGLAANALGGLSPHQPILALGQVSLVAAAAFFLCNSGLVSIVVALSRREPIGKTWYDNFLWTAPACFIGAAIAAVLSHAAAAYVWVLALAAGPLFVTFKAYRIYLGRVEEQQRHLKEVSELHLASVEALARAIDARDQTIEPRPRRRQSHSPRAGAGPSRSPKPPACRADEVEAVKVAALLHDIGKLAVPEHILTKPGRLTAQRVCARSHPSDRRRRDHQGRAVSLSRRAADSEPPRALGRVRLSGRPARRRDRRSGRGCSRSSTASMRSAPRGPITRRPNHEDASRPFRAEAGRAFDPIARRPCF